MEGLMELLGDPYVIIPCTFIVGFAFGWLVSSLHSFVDWCMSYLYRKARKEEQHG